MILIICCITCRFSVDLFIEMWDYMIVFLAQYVGKIKDDLFVLFRSFMHLILRNQLRNYDINPIMLQVGVYIIINFLY